jgi:hypothetical protein
LRRLLSNLFPLLGRQSGSPRLPAHAAERDRSRILPLILGGRHVIGDLSGRYPHDVDGVADHVAGAFFAFWSSWHSATTHIAWR